MDYKTYLQAIKIPVSLFLVILILSYILTFVVFAGITSLEDVLQYGANPSVFSTLLTLFGFAGFAIYLYTGWQTVSKFNGTIINALVAGLLVFTVLFFLRTLLGIVSVVTIPGYKYAILAETVSGGLVAVIIFALLSIPYGLFIAAVLSIVGGFISKRLHKNKQIQ